VDKFAAKVFWMSIPVLLGGLATCSGVLNSKIQNVEIKAATVETSLGDIKARLERMERKIDSLKEKEHE
jgi:hypothetical protein